jgi:hypothetical protein
MKQFNLLTSTALLAGIAALACAGRLNSMPVVQSNPNPQSQAETGTEMTNSLELTERESRSFAVSGMPRIKVSNFEGPITVRAWDQPEVKFIAVKQAVDKQAMSNIRLQAEQQGANVFVTTEFKGPDRKMKIGGGTAFSKGAYVELELNVPRNANVSLFTGDGPLSITGVGGEVSLRTGDGTIDVRDGRGRLSANTNDGLIRILNFDGEVEATDMGDGGVKAEGRFAKLSATTGGGPIALGLPTDSNVTIETDTANVDHEGLAVTEETRLTRNSRRLRIGTGGNIFSLRTGPGGHVTLRRLSSSS